jgi:hypothetical protein
MFCATCGNSVNDKLKYCNNCGAKLANNALSVNNASSPTLPIAVGFFGVAGLFGFIMMLKILLESRLDQPSVLIVLIAYLVALFLICRVIIGNTFRRSDSRKDQSETEPESYAPPQQILHRGITNQLIEPREPFIGSVTDNTTRTLDKVELER